MGRSLEGVVLAKVVGLALRDRMARPGRGRIPEPMVMDDPEGVRVFHESAVDVQLPVYEFNASSMSRLVPEGGSVLELGSGSGQLAAHLVAGRPDVTVRCVDLSQPMVDTGRRHAAERGVDRLEFIVGDITALDAQAVGAPDLVSCAWVLHQLPDRETVVAALQQIATIREEHGSALWIYDMARLRRAPTMPALFDLLNPGVDPRLRVDALASEAAAWTVQELTECLAEAGLTGLTWCRDRLLGLHHAWWASGRNGQQAPAEWTSPPMPPAARRTVDRFAQGMTGGP